MKTPPTPRPAKLIVFEGLDASGKSTQIAELCQFLTSKRLDISTFSFPRTEGIGFGQIIAQFLRGEFGAVQDVDPFLLAAIFAADRLEAKQDLEAAISRSDVVIVDRYVASNVAFQCAKIDDLERKSALRSWIEKTEYKIHALPAPDIVFYFRVPLEFVRTTTVARTTEDRGYLEGKTDIHESAIALQSQVALTFEDLATDDTAFKVIDCIGADGAMKPQQDIANCVRELTEAVLRSTSDV